MVDLPFLVLLVSGFKSTIVVFAKEVPMAKEKKVYYVTKTQYDTLYANGAKTGTLTVGGVTYSYEDDATYFIKEGDSVPIIGALA